VFTTEDPDDVKDPTTRTEDDGWPPPPLSQYFDYFAVFQS
jgi:hypothetical protein